MATLPAYTFPPKNLQLGTFFFLLPLSVSVSHIHTQRGFAQLRSLSLESHGLYVCIYVTHYFPVFHTFYSDKTLLPLLFLFKMLVSSVCLRMKLCSVSSLKGNTYGFAQLRSLSLESHGLCLCARLKLETLQSFMRKTSRTYKHF